MKKNMIIPVTRTVAPIISCLLASVLLHVDAVADSTSGSDRGMRAEFMIEEFQPDPCILRTTQFRQICIDLARTEEDPVVRQWEIINCYAKAEEELSQCKCEDPPKYGMTIGDCTDCKLIEEYCYITARAEEKKCLVPIDGEESPSKDECARQYQEMLLGCLEPLTEGEHACPNIRLPEVFVTYQTVE